jgi:hypothetical protein
MGWQGTTQRIWFSSFWICDRKKDAQCPYRFAAWIAAGGQGIEDSSMKKLP